MTVRLRPVDLGDLSKNMHTNKRADYESQSAELYMENGKRASKMASLVLTEQA